MNTLEKKKKRGHEKGRGGGQRVTGAPTRVRLLRSMLLEAPRALRPPSEGAMMLTVQVTDLWSRTWLPWKSTPNCRVSPSFN